MFNRFLKVIVILIIFLLFIAVTSCTTMKLKEYPNSASRSTEYSCSAEGLLVVIHPLLKRKDCLDYFGLNLIENNILAIYISFKNDNQKQSFLIKSESIRVSDEHELNKKTNIGRNKQDEGEAELMFGGVMLSPLFMAFAGKALSDATIINENYEAKKLRSKTIEPGELEGGFVYFDLNKIKSVGSPLLCLDAVKPISQESLNYCINFSIEDK